MKNIIVCIITVSLFFNSGCKKFIDVNDDPNSLLDVQEALILSPVELDISSNIAAGNASVIVNHWMQNVALNQPVPNSGTYLQNNVDFDADWTNIYVTGLNNLNNLKKKAEANGNFKYSGIAKILISYCLGVATDLWGDVPFSTAFQGSANFLPSYDKQEDIYKSIQASLDAGIADINKGTGKAVGGDDYFYNGDMDKWKKLAYTLKARYYMHLTKAPGYTAAAQADLALAALQNGMQSNADDLRFSYPGDAGHENFLYLTFLPVSTLVLSEHLVDGFKTRNDPRLSKMIAPASSTGLYTGRPIGAVDLGDLDAYSLPGDFYGSPTSPIYIVTYAEALFIKAEATLIKSNAAAAQPIYEDAVRAHMKLLGVSTTEANTYLASRGVLTAANALQLIMEEKSIANFLSLENFNDWRRTGFPVLTKVPHALSEIPRRIIYSQSELIANPQALHTAKLTDRVWWDK
ncbi:MAG: SusD/RagB family nutrient-binding outer membrane lipoprotein [Ferruginibacter sp.]